MTSRKYLLIFVVAVAIAIGVIATRQLISPTFARTVHTTEFGEIKVASHLWGSQGLALIFVDGNQFSPGELAARLAGTGVDTAVVDSKRVFARFGATTGECLDSGHVATMLGVLTGELSLASANRLIVAGIADGALIPFLSAQIQPELASSNISIDFSARLPRSLTLCASLLTKQSGVGLTLVSVPGELRNWRSVWTDSPPDDTAIFLKAMVGANVRIAEYNTPLDSLLNGELLAVVGHAELDVPPMPVVEVLGDGRRDTITIFYSGDGGWRDLDRTVAAEMAKLGHSVVGVDALRYFWNRKLPEQAASDLVATMAYYRRHWGTQAFVLTGFSFGADVLPSIYNKLPADDQGRIALVVLLALAKTTDFEIGLGEWLGRSSSERAVGPELALIPKAKLLCIYGAKEKAETACDDLQNTEATVLALPGGHHFDEDYPKLARLILDHYPHGEN